MVIQTTSRTGSRKKRVSGSIPVPLKKVKVEVIKSDLLSNLFRESLTKMAYMLHPKADSSANHFDCVVQLEINQNNPGKLLAEFLDKTLKLTQLHHSIFSGVNFVDLSENKLVAQLFGIHHSDDESFMISVVKQNFRIERDGKGGYVGYLSFNVDIPS